MTGFFVTLIQADTRQLHSRFTASPKSSSGTPDNLEEGGILPELSAEATSPSTSPHWHFTVHSSTIELVYIIYYFLLFTLYLFIPVHTEWEPGGSLCVHGQGGTRCRVVFETAH